MALRRVLGFSDGELMRSDSKPCSRLVRQTAGIFTVGGGLAFWVLATLHYGPRITIPRSLRWAACGAVSMSTSTALMVRLLSPECEPQNIAAYDKPKDRSLAKALQCLNALSMGGRLKMAVEKT